MGGADRLFRSFSRPKIVNAELCKKAAEKVGNPNVLVNLISRRVRQLNSGGGGLSRPLVDHATNSGWRTLRCAKFLRRKSAGNCPNWSSWNARKPRNAANGKGLSADYANFTD